MEVGELGPESHAGMGQRNRRFCGILQSASLLERNTVVSADAPLLVLGNGKWQQTMWFVECCRCDGGFILVCPRLLGGEGFRRTLSLVILPIALRP
ncbi:hypothetical protein V6N12_011008 [Hibiscus sabdariffa]|uniref:Uncharacterized protein n=1 Tax=Hibiscus sabdariffa TaxID=183260 RepID=A0ABR2ELR8_9ROSI